mmetsp:Transcript_31329/g.93555  ORF Transcript_31329/g.93555 Transcript_31329/m.93555 type:complete len:81 (+) Transcript_31329:1879-2121(+)
MTKKGFWIYASCQGKAGPMTAINSGAGSRSKVDAGSKQVRTGTRMQQQTPPNTAFRAIHSYHEPSAAHNGPSPDVLPKRT